MKPSQDVFNRYKDYLIHLTQVNGSFYSGEPVVLSGDAPQLLSRRPPPEALHEPVLETREAA